MWPVALWKVSSQSIRHHRVKNRFYSPKYDRKPTTKMHLSISLLSFLPLATALQTIYLGTDAAVRNQGQYIAWFSDSNPCNDGTQFGYLPRGFNDCDVPLTILGHTNITFTGCNTGIHASSYPTLPTGVSDDGVPTLTCVAAENPPDAPGYEDGVYDLCGGNNGGIVNVVEYCS